MKLVIIIFAICLTQVFGEPIIQEKAELAAIKNCLINYGVQRDVRLDNLEKLSNIELGCVSACLYKRDGVMLSDGTINESIIYKKYSANFIATYKSCKKGKINCELGECLLSAFERK